MGEYIIHTVYVSNGKKTILKFENSINGLLTLYNAYNFCFRLYKYNAENKVRADRFINFIEIMVITHDIFTKNYFADIDILDDEKKYDECILSINDSELINSLKDFVKSVKSYEIPEYLKKDLGFSDKEDEIKLRYINAFETILSNYRISDDYEFLPGVIDANFEEYNYILDRYVYDEELCYDIDDDDDEDDEDEDDEYSNDIGLFQHDMLQLLDEIGNAEISDEEIRNSAGQFLLFSINYPLHPSFMKHLYRIIKQKRSLTERYDYFKYTISYLKELKGHKLFDQYKDDYDKLVSLLEDIKCGLKIANFKEQNVNETTYYRKVKIPTMYNDGPVFVVEAFDTLVSKKDKKFFDDFKITIDSYDLNDADECTLLVQDFADVLKDSELFKEYDCLNKIVSLNNLPSKKELIIMANLIHDQYNIVINTPQYKVKFEKNHDNNQEGRDSK